MPAKRKKVGAAFGRALREARQACGISQEELAARIDYSARHISFLETGRREPTLATVLSLEAGLGLTAGSLSRKTKDQIVAGRRSR